MAESLKAPTCEKWGRHIKYIPWLLVAGVLIGLACLATRDSSPVHNGKTLNQWLAQLDDGNGEPYLGELTLERTPAQDEAIAAIDGMKQKAIPILFEMIRKEDPLTTRFRDNYFLQRWFGVIPSAMVVKHSDIIRWRAALALAHFGATDESVRMELERLFGASISTRETAFALAATGPEGIRTLTNYVPVSANSTFLGGDAVCAMWAIAQNPESARQITPFLIQVVEITNSPDKSMLVHQALLALKNIGPDAANAIPMIKYWTSDPELASEAESALKAIQSATTNSSEVQ